MSRQRNPILPALKAHILAGGTPKEFSAAASKSNVFKLIHSIGFKRHYLTADEAKHIMQRRKSMNLIRSNG